MGTSESAPRSPRRRVAFSALAALLVAAGLELGCRLIERLENAWARGRNPFVEAVNPVPAYQVHDEGGTRVVRRSGFHPLMGDQSSFPLAKPPGGLRVFVLGGSAAAGWPFHTGETNISAFLRRKLERLHPGRSVEVVNMAAGTYASHRVKLILEEVVRYGPDAIFVYNGNNEFLENLVYRPRTPPGPWGLSAAARLAYRIAGVLSAPRPRFEVEGYDIRAQDANALSFAFSRASRYREDPAQFQELLAHYRYNMESMAETAAAAGIPLVLVTCPVNLKDWSPNVSRHRRDLAPPELARWTEHFREGVQALERGDVQDARASLLAAAALDAEYAEAHFLLGGAELRSGRPAPAKAAFLAALRTDAFPFRELPEFQAILADVAAERRVPLLDVVPALEAASADGILGREVFLDYVHLNEAGQEIVAQGMLEAMLARGLLPGLGAEDVAGARLPVEHAFSAERDTYAADVSYNMAMLMHQYGRLDALYQELVSTFTRAAREDPARAQAYLDRLGLFRKVHAIASAYRDLVQASKLGLARQRYSPEEAERVRRMYVEMIYQSKGAGLERERFEALAPRDPFSAP